MKKFHTTFFVLTLVAILFSACSNHKVKLTDPDQDMLDSISMIAMNPSGDTTQHNLIRPAARGLEWKAWEAWFKDCPQNQTFKNNIVYLGPASTKNVGFIMSKDLSLDKWDFFKLSKDTATNSGFIENGTDVGSCNISQMKDFSLNMLAGGKIFSSVDASLGGLLSNAKTITLKSGSWRIQNLTTGPFMAFVNSSSDANIVAYREALTNKKNIILTRVLKVSGFELEIVAKDSISAGVNATLQNGFKVNVVAPDSTHKIGFSLTFKKGTKNTVSVSSQGEFSLFAQASKGVELNQ